MEYKFIQKTEDISKAAFKIKDQEYTGEEIELDKEDFTSALINKTTRLILEKDFEIVCYEKNIKKGTAKVTVRGINQYGGYKNVSFRIVQRSVSNHWPDGFRNLAQAFGF